MTRCMNVLNTGPAKPLYIGGIRQIKIWVAIFKLGGRDPMLLCPDTVKQIIGYEIPSMTQKCEGRLHCRNLALFAISWGVVVIV